MHNIKISFPASLETWLHILFEKFFLSQEKHQYDSQLFSSACLAS